MSYHVYPIIYHNGEFMQLIKEKVFMNLCKAHRKYFAQGKVIFTFRNYMLSRTDDLMRAFNSEECSELRDILKELKLLINKTVDDMFFSLRLFLKEEDWLRRNIYRSEEATIKMWWEMADQNTRHEKLFEGFLAIILKVSLLFPEMRENFAHLNHV